MWWCCPIFFFFCGTKRGRPCIFVVRLAWPCFVLEDDGQTWPILSSKRVLNLPSPNRRTMGATDVDLCSALLHRSLFIPGGPIRTRNRSFSLSCRSVFRTRAMPATTTLAANGTRSAESSVPSVDRFREESAAAVSTACWTLRRSFDHGQGSALAGVVRGDAHSYRRLRAGRRCAAVRAPVARSTFLGG